MERVAPAARADTSIRSAAYQDMDRAFRDDDFETSPFGWDLMREPPSSVEAIRSDIAILRERLAQAAPRRVVVEMDRAISLLSRQMDEMRRSGDEARADDNAAVETELRKLKAALDKARAPERFQALAAGIDALTRKVDALAAKVIDPVEIARLQRQTDEMKDLAARALAPGGLREIAERIATCAETVERRGEEMARRMGEATQAFERSTETLLAKVKQFESSYILGGHANAEQLRRDVTAEVKSINGRLDQMLEKISGLSPAAGTAFAERLDALLERIESVGDVDKAAVAPLTAAVEEHLTRLTERVRDAQDRLGRLDTIETSLARVLAEMELVREAAISAPAEAAQAVVMKVSEAEAGPAVVGLKRGLAALEARQDELERRTGLADELEGELHELTTDLGRAEHDASLWMPRDAAAPQEAPWEEAEPVEEALRPAPGPRAEARAAPGPAHGAPHNSHRGGPQAAAHHAGPKSEFRDPHHAAPQGAPKGTHEAAPQSARHAAAPDAAAPHGTPHAAAAHPAPGAEVPPKAGEAAGEERKARPRRVRIEPGPDIRIHRLDEEGAGEVEWPHSTRRVDWTVGKAGARKDRKVTAGKRAGRRHAMMLILLAGAAAALLMTTAAGLAFQQKPDLLSGVSAAFGRLQEQGASMFSFLSPVRNLPAPVGPEPLRTAAFSGNVDAAYAVGVRYAEGLGTKADAQAAEKWLAYAVSKGSAPAAYRLGSLYEHTARNLKEAQRFYAWAAEQGNVRAMHNLGVIYSQGLDGRPDWDNAIKWFRKSADMGQTDSQYNLGVIYARGLSGQSDPAEAWKWFALAASQGDADSASKRDSLMERADPNKLARARDEAEIFKALPYDMAANTVRMRPEWGMSAPETMAGTATQATQRAL